MRVNQPSDLLWNNLAQSGRMETANVYGELAAVTGQGRAQWVYGWEEEINGSQKRGRGGKQYRWLLCTQNPQKTWTDEGRENPGKVRFKGAREDG